jgi:hypothetical protein
MKKQNKMIHLLPLMLIGFLLIFVEGGFSRDISIDWGLLPWGLDLEGLNKAFKERVTTGQITEDRDRNEIDVQYAPTKSVKVKRGKLVALLGSMDPSRPGRLFGYSYEGKFFGKVFLFKDHPEVFPETAISLLKGEYPKGRIFRNFSQSRNFPSFEFRSETLYVFTTERGVYFYEPDTLSKIVKHQLDLNESDDKKNEERLRDEMQIR